MLYLFDANVLIDANRDYYPISRVPEFWSWLHDFAEKGNIRVVPEVYDELLVGSDELTDWASQKDVKDFLLLDEDADPHLVSRVVDNGYADDLTDAEVEKLGRDPFLIAHALVDPADRLVVTTEVSKPSKVRANRKVPDICASFGIKTLNTFELIRVLDFQTSWK